MSDLPLGLSRRRFLTTAGVAAGAVLLGACGGGDDKTDASDTTRPSKKLVLAPFFGEGQLGTGPTVRAPFGVADDEGLLLTKDAPSTIEVVVTGPDDKPVGDALRVQRRAEGLPRPYYPLEVSLPDAGIYTVRAKGAQFEGAEMHIEVSDPAALQLVRPGLVLPPLDTPTVADPRGVMPICTRTPVCPLHDVTLAQALAEKKPVGLIISTPYFCKVAICGPVLELVVAAAGRHPGVRLLHAEVYADPFNDPDIAKGGGRLSPTMEAMGLLFEPVLILAGSDGTVTQRLDSIWDVGELDDALAALS